MRTNRNMPIKDCLFCKEGKNPSYLDYELLKKFTSDRGKIVSRGRSGACSKHQRKLTTHIKYARHLALLPFIVRPE